MVEMGDPWVKLATYTSPYQTAWEQLKDHLSVSKVKNIHASMDTLSISFWPPHACTPYIYPNAGKHLHKSAYHTHRKERATATDKWQSHQKPNRVKNRSSTKTPEREWPQHTLVSILWTPEFERINLSPQVICSCSLRKLILRTNCL